MIVRVSRGGRLAQVALDRRRRRRRARPAPPALPRRVADLGDQVVGLGRVRIGLEDRVEQRRPARPWSTGRTWRDAVDARRRPRPPRRRARGRGRRCRSARSRRSGTTRRRAPSPRPTRPRRGTSSSASARRTRFSMPRREHDQHARRRRPTRVRGRRATRSPTRRQAPCVSSAPASPKCGTRGQKARRPKIASSAGSSVSIETIATPTPSAPIGPRPAVPLTLASDSDSSASMTVTPEAKIAGPARRSAMRQRLVAVLVAAQLLAVAGDEQQRVVGARAEHEHRQDRRRLAVDGDARLGQRLAQRAARDLGEHHRGERDPQEDRAAVDERQQDEDERAPPTAAACR